MKNKLLYLNMLVLLFICIIGFSPQMNKYTSVYAAPTTETKTDSDKPENVDIEENKDYITSIEGFVQSEGGSSLSSQAGAIAENIKNSTDNLDKIVKSLQMSLSVLANIVGVVIIALTGFKFMRSSAGNLPEFIKSQKEIKSALVCVLFIMIIPVFTSTILNTKLPSSIKFTQTSSGYIATGKLDSSNAAIGTSTMIPSSSLVSFFKDSDFKKSSSDLIGKNDPQLTSSLNGITRTVVEAFLSMITIIFYYPFKLVVSSLGILSFYPVSFDPGLYEEKLLTSISANYIQDSIFKIFIKDLADNGICKALSSAFTQFTAVINLLYFIIKNFVMMAIDLVCYYYGIMHLLKQDTATVPEFLKRFAQGILGMLFAPYIIQFMIDLDVMISSAILSLTVKGVPGLGLLSLLPDIELMEVNLFSLFFGIISCCVLFNLCKVFFVRRVEITLYYIVSPIVFLFHIGSKKDKSPVQKWFNTLKSSIFLTTMYSPLFAITSLLIALAGNTGTEGGVIASFIYYILIIGILWFSKDVADNIMGLFSVGGGSVTAGMAKQATSAQSISDTFKSNVKLGTGATVGAVGLGFAAKRNIGTFNNLRKEIDEDTGKHTGIGKSLRKSFIDPTAIKLKYKAIDKFNDITSTVIPKTRLQQEEEMEQLKLEHEKKKEDKSREKLSIDETDNEELKKSTESLWESSNEENVKLQELYGSVDASNDTLKKYEKEAALNPTDANQERAKGYKEYLDELQRLSGEKSDLIDEMVASLEKNTPEGAREAIEIKGKIKEKDLDIDKNELFGKNVESQFNLSDKEAKLNDACSNQVRHSKIDEFTNEITVAIDANQLVDSKGLVHNDLVRKFDFISQNTTNGAYSNIQGIEKLSTMLTSKKVTEDVALTNQKEIKDYNKEIKMSISSNTLVGPNGTVSRDIVDKLNEFQNSYSSSEQLKGKNITNYIQSNSNGTFSIDSAHIDDFNNQLNSVIRTIDSTPLTRKETTTQYTVASENKDEFNRLVQQINNVASVENAKAEAAIKVATVKVDNADETNSSLSDSYKKIDKENSSKTEKIKAEVQKETDAYNNNRAVNILDKGNSKSVNKQIKTVLQGNKKSIQKSLSKEGHSILPEDEPKGKK